MGEYLPGIIALFVLLASNAFFVGAEFAVISARRSQVEPLAEQGNKSAKTAIWAMEHATLMLATCQLGITMSSIMILLVSEPAVHALLEAPLVALGLSHDVISPIAFVVTLAVVTFLHVVVGEMIPKNMAFSVPTKAVLLLAPPLVWFSKLFGPAIRIMNNSANLVLRLTGVEPKDSASTTYTLEQIETIVEESTTTGLLDDASGVLTASFEFTELRARDIMVPADQVIHLPANVSVLDVQDVVREHGFSRYIINGNGGVARGYVHIKDLFDTASTSDLNEPLPTSLIRPISTTEPDAGLEDVLAQMREQGNHVFGVVQPEGTVAGYIFLEDILEELIGEVTDVLQPAS